MALAEKVRTYYHERCTHYGLLRTANKKRIGRILSHVVGAGLKLGTAFFPEAAPITTPLMAVNK
jgi:hypothetical protein